MRKEAVWLSALALGVCSAGQAAEYGLGVSLSGDNRVIYLPVNISPSWRVEPYGQFYRSVVESSSSANSSIGHDLGLGAFKLGLITSQVRIYGGARVAKTHHNREPHWTGYSISPTIGAEYYFVDKFSIAGEASLSLSRAKTEFVNESLNTTNELTKTETQVVLRYLF